MLVRRLARLPADGDRGAWAPFQLTLAIMVLGFAGIAYSFFPFVVPGEVTIWQAAAARGSLAIMLAGALVTLPIIIAYSAFAYTVFRGKATGMRYE